MTAKYVHFQDPNPLEYPIYLDTDILVFYYGPAAGWTATNAAKVAASQAFLNRCIRDDVILVTSSQTIMELRGAIFVGMYESHGVALGLKGPGRLSGRAYRQEPTYAEKVYEEIERVEGLLSQMRHLVQIEQEIDEPLLRSAAGHIFQYHLEPSDAMHVMLAGREGVTTFATTDRMWGEVPGLTIYTPHRDLVKS